MKTTTLKPAVTFLALIVLIVLSSVVRGQDIQPYKAEEIKPYKAEEVKPNKASETRPKVRVIKPYRTKKANPTKPGIATPKTTQVPKALPASGEVSGDFFGLYQYWVPGTSYTIPDYTNNQLVIHNSAGTGVLPGGIKISSDGTYVWNSSWDEKVIKGKWRSTGDADYPLELLQAQEGKNWKVGKTTGDPSRITIWDGSTWYNGEKIKK